jgi:hypothetical protein
MWTAERRGTVKGRTKVSDPMPEPRYITLRVSFDSHTNSERTLRWIAPELARAGLAMTDDHMEGRVRYRTWAGSVDEATVRQLMEAWRLTDPIGGSGGENDDDRQPASRAYTLDGMNWETDGRSPVVWASVEIGRGAAATADAGIAPDVVGAAS